MPRRAEPQHAGRDSLVAAAAERFSRVGFAGASVSDIAKDAGVTQPLVNHHFGTKKGLWQAVVHELFGQLEDALQASEARTATRPEREQLRELIRTYVTFCGEHPHLLRMLRIEADSELAREVHQKWQRRFVAYFEGRLERAIAHRVLAPVDPHFLFFVVVGAATEIFSQRDLAQRAFRLDVADPAVIRRAADFVCDFVLKGASP
ncbi:MAG: TetR/AcrR family transcriptional regulator [Myxococcota bacterium]